MLHTAAPHASKILHLTFERFAEFIEGSPHLTENEVMEYSHWEYNTDDEDEDRARDDEDLYTDDDEEADAASDENLDYWSEMKNSIAPNIEVKLFSSSNLLIWWLNNSDKSNQTAVKSE